MKRRIVWVTLTMTVALLSVVLWYVARERTHRRKMDRAARMASQAAILKYSQNLAPGVTRKEVENYLRARHTDFSRRCCLESHDTFSDLVTVAEEQAPWYCSAWPIYVAFVFALPP